MQDDVEVVVVGIDLLPLIVVENVLEDQRVPLEGSTDGGEVRRILKSIDVAPQGRVLAPVRNQGGGIGHLCLAQRRRTEVEDRDSGRCSLDFADVNQ